MHTKNVRLMVCYVLERNRRIVAHIVEDTTRIASDQITACDQVSVDVPISNPRSVSMIGVIG